MTVKPLLAGYKHPSYAHSLLAFGCPLELPRSKGKILKKKIQGFPYYDGMGCYPLFCCTDWDQLIYDLNAVTSEIVSLCVVTDPFGDYTFDYLNQCFIDITFPFKEHYVIDLSHPISSFVSVHHRRNMRKAIQNVRVEICNNPSKHLDEWVSLYQTLVKKHNIKGLTVFSRTGFAKQFQVPGLVVFRAVDKTDTVGMILWYVQGDVGYYHLAAYSSRGYELLAAFALFWISIEYFKQEGLAWLNLGAGAGIDGDSSDGLSRFKKGWATGTRTAYFCGRIYDRTKYNEIIKIKGVHDTDYFPAYRQGEF